MDAVLRGFREKGLSYLIVGPFAIVLAFPFYVMVITAFKQQRDFYDLSHSPYWFHKGPTLSNARFLFNETQYTTWLRNTAIVGVAVVLITLVLAVPAGYALARLSGKLGQSVGVGIFLTYLVPPTLLFLPLFSVITQLDRQTSHLLHFHLRGSIWSLVLVYPSFTVPFATWLLMGFFKTIPRELEDAGPHRFSYLRSGHLDCRDLFLLARRERVRVRVHVHLCVDSPHAVDGCLHGSDPRRSAAMGSDHGRLAHTEHSARAPLQHVPRPVHRGLHRGSIPVGPRKEG